jgi:hypothetical protein
MPLSMPWTAPTAGAEDLAEQGTPFAQHRDFALHAVPGGVLAVRDPDDRLVRERLDAGDYVWVVAAPDLPTLRRRIDLLAMAMPALEATRQAMAQHDVASARAHLPAIAALAGELRPVLIDAYLRAPKASQVQTALGLVCLAMGRHEEGMFHLLRAVPGQVEWFAVCRRYHQFRTSPAACRQLVLCTCAAAAVGRTQQAELLHRTLRMGVRLMRLAATCDGLDGDLLWKRPDVLVNVRGVLDVGTVPASLADLRRLEIPRLLAFATGPAHEAELTSTLVACAAPAPAWRVVASASGPRPPAMQLDPWFAAGQASAADYNLLRLGPQVPAHDLLRSSVATLRGIDFVSVVIPEPSATPEPGSPAEGTARRDAATPDDPSTVPGLLAPLGFVKIDATEPGPGPRQVLYARAEHV